MANTFVPIQSVTIGTIASSLTISSIPQTYTDLVVRMSLRSTIAINYDSLTIQANENGSAVYSFTDLYAVGTTVGSTTNAGSGSVNANNGMNGSGTNANTFSSLEFVIPNYTSSTNKACSISYATEANSATIYRIGAVAGLIRITSGITSLTFSWGSNVDVGSTFHLYGIKNS